MLNCCQLKCLNFWEETSGSRKNRCKFQLKPKVVVKTWRCWWKESKERQQSRFKLVCGRYWTRFRPETLSFYMTLNWCPLFLLRKWWRFLTFLLTYVLHSGKRPLIVRLSSSCKVLLQVHHRRAGPQSQGCRFGGPGFHQSFFHQAKGTRWHGWRFSKDVFWGDNWQLHLVFFVCRNKWDVFICHRPSPFNLTKNGGDEVFFHAKRLKGREYSNSCRMGCLYPTFLRWEIHGNTPKASPKSNGSWTCCMVGRGEVDGQTKSQFTTLFYGIQLQINHDQWRLSFHPNLGQSKNICGPRSKSWPKRESELHNWGVSHIYPAATKVTRL